MNEKIAFLSDLDNTLIYSHKRDIGEKKITAEIYNEKIVSYMTEKTYTLLDKARNEVCFIPVSTRSVQQYNRITFNKSWSPKTAVVSNGGTLLVDGKEDKVWKNESLKLISECMPELEKASKLLEKDLNRTLDVRLVDGLFVFTKSSDSEKTMKILAENIDKSIVNIFTNGIKIYAVPKILNKGTAVERIKERFGFEEVIAAGDSDFDIPMLNNADMSFYPSNMKEMVSGGIAVPDERLMSEYILEYVLDYIKKHI
ncbi:MAG: HAD hydrolase family protein [Clostridia bacterium]|nr:HAD hydrolase family protein [Clostridia bacterium]